MVFVIKMKPILIVEVTLVPNVKIVESVKSDQIVQVEYARQIFAKVEFE